MHQPWVNAISQTVSSYRQIIDATLVQLTDAELRARPAENINSVAVLLRHLGGNLRSRWTDFLTTDGEKPDRDRDSEFEDWQGDRGSLMAFFDSGWDALTNAIRELDTSVVSETVYIRGEPHSVPQALARSVTHLAYHVGQIVMIARMVHEGEWKWLTIAPGKSSKHNEQTWGTSASRSILGSDD